MTVDTDPTPEPRNRTRDPTLSPTPTPRNRWRAPLFIASGFAAGLGAAAATSAYGDGWRGGPGVWHHGGPVLDARAEQGTEEMSERMVRHLAVEIDATAEQQAKLVAIARDVSAELVPLRQSMQQAREQARALLTAETVDRTAIEALRAEQVALVDSASKRIADALVDASEVLTPEQRTEVAELMETFRGMHGGGQGRRDQR